MYSFTSKVPFHSELFPGVVVNLRRLTTARRAEIDSKSAGAREKIRQIIMDVSTDLKADDDSERARQLRTDIYFHRRKIELQEAAPVELSVCVINVEGAEYDGEPIVTVEDLLAKAPPELIYEVYDFIETGMRLTEAERKNSSLASTSPAAADGKTQTSTATPASVAETTAPATAS